MDTPNEHINPWAEKLQELNSSGASESWQSMNALLDAERPIRSGKDRRRWILLVILLLLITGVCRFPHTDQIAVRKEAPSTPSRSDARVAVESNPKTASKKVLPEMPASMAHPERVKTGLAKEESRTTKRLTAGSEPFQDALSERPAGTENKNPTILMNSDATASATTEDGHPNGGDPIPSFEAPANPDRTDSAARNRAKPTSAIRNTGKKATPATAAKKAENDSLQDSRGWTFGLGLNQFFAIAGQQSSQFNADGTSGNISDYLPVPVVRYYFHQWFYLQAEAQINSPQYTQTLLAGQGIKTAALAGEDAVQSVFIKKLFYFNVPVSIHYSPVKNLYLGVGLQYSRLTNGVALIQDTRLNGGYIVNQANGADSILIQTKTENLKHDSAYQHLRTQEWRFLADLNYQWKRVTIGLRYNQAFRDFINVQVSSLHLTQAQNRSLQVYLRYTILDRRKKFMIARP